MKHALSAIRANLLGSVLLVVAFTALVTALIATAAVAFTGDRTEDLTFSGATNELSRLLMANGPGRVGRLEHVAILVGRDTVFADTIVVLADSSSEPAFAKGGFVHDQVAAYNDNAVRQAVLAATRRDPAASAASEGTSLFRTVFTEDGTRRLSDRPSPYALAIRSPYAEGSWREVRTTDWRSSPGLLGYEGEVALDAGMPAGPSRVRLNGRECYVEKDAPQYLMYCRSLLAADSRRFYDFGFELQPAALGGGFASAFPYRQRDIWMNGRAQAFGKRAVAGGDVLDVQWLGPFVLSATDWGTLAAEQWINGRRTFANQSVGTMSFFAVAGRSTPSATPSATPLVLGFDAALSADLEHAATRFLTDNGRLLSRMAVVIIDARSGEVRAIAEPARTATEEPLLSFEPILVGSVVKPIMAAAILSRQPALVNLRLPYAGDTVTTVAGIPLVKGFANAANGCHSDIDFIAFLRCSSNQYAAELVVRSLQHDGFASEAAAGAVVPRKTLEASAIATGLAEAFDVDASAGRTRGRLALYWNPDSATTAGAGAVTTDRSLIPWESRPWLVFPDSSGTRVDWLARYAFGGWENRWTLLGLAQAYARIATGRNTQVTFVHRDPPVRPFPAATPRVAAAFSHVRTALREVPVNGTAAGLAEKLQAATKQPVVVMAKTGTLNEGTASGKLKTLAIAMGRAASSADTAAITCGLVAVSYFEFADRWNDASGRTSLPRIHLEFAEGPFAGVMARHFSRVGGCTPPPARTDIPLPPVARK